MSARNRLGWLLLFVVFVLGINGLLRANTVLNTMVAILEADPPPPATIDEEWEANCDLDTMQGAFAEAVCGLRGA